MYSWWDGHLDLAYLALEGRDVRRPLQEALKGPQPPSITFPSLAKGHVRGAMGTIFPVPKMFAPYGYAKGDREAAHLQSVQQLHFYHRWEREGEIQIVRSSAGLEKSAFQTSSSSVDSAIKPLHVVLSIEGAIGVRSPEEMHWWFEQGVRIVGLSWALGSPFSGGNVSGGPLTSEGEECLKIMDGLGMIHDLSHLSDATAWALLERSDGPVIASHSNVRALLGEAKKERHLSDALIDAIGARKGVIGLNLLGRFLRPVTHSRQATLEDAVAHIEYICERLGHQSCVALGSDMDGGFGADQLVDAIQTPQELVRLLEVLSQRGWSDDELEGFAYRNWLHFLHTNLPA